MKKLLRREHKSAIGRMLTYYEIIIIAMFLLPMTANATTIIIVDDVQRYTNLSGNTVNMSGVSELHVTSETTPISGCTVNLNSSDSFLFLEGIKPSVVNSTYLSQVKVNGANAVLNTNVRVVEYAAGSVIIPQSSTFQPLQVFTGDNFQGNSMYLGQSHYDTVSLGSMANAISSFILKRGYTATFAQNADGTGYSKNYVAQDCDMEIGVLPGKLNNQINFIRVFPWRWTGKKGACESSGDLNLNWWYSWGSGSISSQNTEFVAMRHNAGWDTLNRNWWNNGVNHLLGFNEPDRPDQANMSVTDAISMWPMLSATGLRLGAPAVSDGGRSWIYDFISRAKAADLRVDYVPVHYYLCYSDNNDPAGAAAKMYNNLKAVHDNTGLPIWVTEWNNGANWTSCADPTPTQNRDVIEAMMNMMDSTPWIERYAIYSWVEWFRQTHYDQGGLTPMGVMYRDHTAPIAYQQEALGFVKSANTIYSFDDNFRDSSGNGNNPLFYGAPKRVAGQNGNAVVLDGIDDYLVLSTHMGEDADFTFAAWVYWNGGTQQQRIFDFGNGSAEYMFLSPNSGGNLRFGIKTTAAYQNIYGSSPLAVGVWTHVAVTLNGNTGTLYVNGTPLATNTSMTNNPSTMSPQNNYIGKSQWSADPLFDGMLDDVIVADYALSTNQIATLFTDNQPGQFIGAPLDIKNVVAGAEQNNNPAVNSYDRNRSTRWANDGNVANAWIQYDLGTVSEINRIKMKLYNGASRTNPIRIEIDGVQVFNGSTSTTDGYWETKFTPTSGRYVTITMTGNNSDGSGWFGMWETQIWGPLNELPSFNTPLFGKPDGLELSAYTGTLVGDASDPENGPLTYSKDAGPDWLTVAPDGTLSGTPMDSDTGLNVFAVRVTDDKGLYDTAEMTIQVDNVFYGTQGMEDILGLANEWLTQDCGMCNGADLDGDNDVTFTDFSMLAHNWLVAENLQLWLKFDEMAGSIASDGSIYRRSGLLVNSPVWSAGRDGGGLDFDGSNYVEVAHDDGLNPAANSFSVAFWMKSDAARQGALIVSKRQNTSPYPGYLIGLSNGTPTRFSPGSKLTYLIGADSGDRKGGYTTSDIVFNEWTHVCVVLDRDADTVYIYVNGVSVPVTRTPNDSLPTINTTTPLYVGKNPAVSSESYDGLVDDVRIYNVALSEQEVQGIASP